MSKKPPQRVSRSLATVYLNENWGTSYSAQYLAKLAVVGGGPKFQKIGKFAIYDISDLNDWMESRSSGLIASTAEGGSRND